MATYIGEGRIRGNIGTFVVEEAKDKWDAERLIRNATATIEQSTYPEVLRSIPPSFERELEDLIASLASNPRQKVVYELNYGVTFLEYISPNLLRPPTKKELEGAGEPPF